MTGRSGGGADGPAEAITAADRSVMGARLAAMAEPRPDDNPRVAALRAVLRDEALMAHVTANVDRWPPMTEEQRDAVAMLLGRSAYRTRRAA